MVHDGLEGVMTSLKFNYFGVDYAFVLGESHSYSRRALQVLKEDAFDLPHSQPQSGLSALGLTGHRWDRVGWA